MDHKRIHSSVNYSFHTYKCIHLDNQTENDGTNERTNERTQHISRRFCQLERKMKAFAFIFLIGRRNGTDKNEN